MDGLSSLRPASIDDLPQLVEIERRVHVAPWNEENFKGEMAKPYSQVLLITDDETDTKVIGYIVFWLMFDECQILNVVVDLPYRGLGFAKQMVQKAVAQAAKKNLKRVILDVRRGNLAAIQLYQRLGFTVTRVQKKFYTNGEDAYLMTLDLSGVPVDF
jgi:[ribosomal protein S18]-alanine N-acetyltransferase